jgi:hypothetical protein
VSGSPTTTSQGSVPFGVSTRAIVMPVYLTDTFRSQGFSPSQRFHPARASWLCFTPHPPLGFRSSELFPLGQPWRLSASSALLPFRLAPAVASDLVSTFTPAPAGSVSGLPRRPRPPLAPCAPGLPSASSRRPPAEAGLGEGEAAGRPRGWCAKRPKGATGFVWPSRSHRERAGAGGFRALLQPSVRSRTPAVRPVSGPMLS